jgi:diaminohydroxyphosphoribosylaminopyrimidine deaminase/5-amino-6-(5-phosphoribosylamino)uracil reductase
VTPPHLRPPEIDALHRAIVLAGRGAGTALPNPVVGCALLAPGGWVVGEGFHDAPGGPHAEVEAIAAAGGWASGATAVVTLEPCNHTGRTGPCSEALIAAGVARVVVVVRDPWPPAAGGIDRLRAAGVDVVDLADPGVEPAPAVAAAVAAAQDVNRVWLTAHRLARPFVTWKVGMTIDGRVAAADGSSRWITSAASRADVHRLRAAVDTMMVGVGTVLADDPQLTVRDENGVVDGVQPLRVVVDSAGRTPSGARVVDAAAETWVATLEDPGPGPDGRVDLAAVLDTLYRRGRRHVLLEGGPRLAAAFLDAGLIDEVLVYLAPTLLGAGRSALDGGAVGTLTDAHAAELMQVEQIGPDVRLRYAITHR